MNLSDIILFLTHALTFLTETIGGKN